MRILWLINAPFYELSLAAGLPATVKEGWIEGLFKSMLNKLNGDELVIVFPQMVKSETIKGELEGCTFFGFYKENDKPYLYSQAVEDRLKAIVDEVKPDVVHIAGTEYDHAAAMVKAFGKPEKTIVSIQGLTSVYARHYMADLPVSVRFGRTFRDFVKHDNLKDDQKRYEQRGKLEIETIKGALNIVGRTDWDKACTKLINPEAKYYHCGEILRGSFYEKAGWSYADCQKHSIFVSQGYYPIKGLHHMLEALADILRFYPDAHLYVAGGVTLNNKGLKPRLKQKKYQQYLASLVSKYYLEQAVTFLSPLDATAMKERYLKSNVFVSPSSIENSPNSLGEAMYLGVPCVTSHVGGVANMLTHGVEGYTYQSDAPYMLAHYVMEIFRQCEEEPDRITSMNSAAKQHAAVLFDRDINGQTMIDIYREVGNKH